MGNNFQILCDRFDGFVKLRLTFLGEFDKTVRQTDKAFDTLSRLCYLFHKKYSVSRMVLQSLSGGEALYRPKFFIWKGCIL